MEEIKNENVTEQPAVEETVVEQRPSTKYGRTAYQQQMQEEQVAQEAPVQEQPVYQQPQQEWNGQQNPYQQYQNPYTPYEESKPEVKNVFAYILMALVGMTGIISFVLNVMAAEAYSMGNSIEEIVNATLVIAEQPLYLVLSTVSDLVFWVTIVFLVLDIIQLNKAGKKITGAILFAIFLRPAYFIWRAHLLGQKKVGAIIFTVAFYLLSLVQFSVLLSASMEMVMRTMY